MMSKMRRSVAAFFTILFVAILSLPTIIFTFNDSADTSIFYSLSEEEENEYNLKLVFEENSDAMIFIESENTVGELVYTSKTYSKPHLNLIFPPPESFFIITQI